MDRGAWQATVCRIAKSQTQLKQLSMHARSRTSLGLYQALSKFKTFALQKTLLRKMKKLATEWEKILAEYNIQQKTSI